MITCLLWFATLAAAGVTALAVLLPSYAWFGMPAIEALLGRRNQASADNFYRLILPTHHFLGFMAAILVIATAVLVMRRLPPGDPGRPAVRSAVALTAAWLFLWALPAALLRRGDHLRARAVPRVTAGLAGTGPAHGGHNGQHAGQPTAATRPYAEPS